MNKQIAQKVCSEFKSKLFTYTVCLKFLFSEHVWKML